MLPDASVAVVPDTCTTLPTRTAREYPTIGSHIVPEEMLMRFIPPSPMRPREYFTLPPPFAVISKIAHRYVIHFDFPLVERWENSVVILRSPRRNSIPANSFAGRRRISLPHTKR